MKKKFFNVMLLVAMVIAASASFISCTDKTGDDYNNLAASYLDLAAVVDAQNKTLQDQLDALKAAQQQCKENCAAAQQALQDEIDALQKQVNDLNGDSIKSLREQVQDLKDAIAALQAQDALFQNAINNINITLNDYNTRITKNEGDIVNLTNLYNTMNQTLIQVQQDLAAIKQLAQDALDKANAAQSAADAAQATADAAKTAADAAQATADANKASIDQLTEKFNDYYTKAEINAGLDTLKNKLAALETDIAKAQARADAAYAYAEANKTLIDQLTDKFNNYYTKEEIDSMKAEVEQQVADAKAVAEAAQVAAEAAQATADAAYTLALEALSKADANATKIYELEQALASVVDQVSQNTTDIAALQQLVDALDQKIDDVQSDLQGQIDTNAANITALNDALNNAVSDLQDQIDALTNRVDALETQVANILDEMDILKDAVDEIRDDIAKMISGVILQGAYNSILGQFALPVGIQSNILFGFFGQNTGAGLDFPIDVVDAEGNPIELDAVTGVPSYYIGNGEELVDDMENGKANLGTLFATINPNTVDFTGQTLKLVDSQDKEYGIDLEPLEKSDETLTLGYTRAANNGFYQANASISADKVESIRITKDIDKSELASAARDVLNSLRNRSISGLNLSGLYKLMLETIKNFKLPAYGLKASWTDSQGEHSTYSNYNLAATSVKPASYEFLMDKDLPTIPHIGQITYDVDFHLKAPSYNYITNPNLELTVYVVYDIMYGNKVVVGVYTDEADADAYVASHSDAEKKTMKFTVSGLQSFIDTINKDIIGKLTDDIKELEDEIVSQAQSNVNKALDKVNTKIVSRVNNWIDKINARIKNANHYLQPIMLVEGSNDKWYLASDSWLAPHAFYGTGYVRVELTSLTAEILAPAFKKYVAVTNVFKNGDPTVSAKNGNNTCLNILNKANEAVNVAGCQNMNSVFNGNHKDVAFFASQTGYTYEVTYAAVDYTGRTRFTQCYVKTIEP